MAQMVKSEQDKMIAGELYYANDPALAEARSSTREMLLEFNSTSESLEGRDVLVRKLFPNVGQGFYATPPFYCDYGWGITAGENVYFNFNCTVLDGAPVSIGSNTLFGPCVQIYTACHQLNSKERATGIEFGKPVTIGHDCWVGGGVIICPGVRIGNRTVVGAGSVVTRNLPDGVVAAGNPARVIRRLEEGEDPQTAL